MAWSLTAIPEMTDTVSSRTINPIQSFAHLQLFVVFQMACQYQLCRQNDLSEAVKWYGWMVIGSLGVGVGSWGDVQESADRVSYYLYNLGIAFVPYTMPAGETG